MDEQVIDDLYARAQSKGYKKGRLDFIQLIQSDEDVFNDMYQYVQAKGYKKDSQDFSFLIGKTEAPAVKKKDTASVSEPGSLVSPEPEAAVEPAIAPAPPTPEIQDITAPDTDFFEERMAMVSPELIDRGDEDEVAQELTKVFKPYGFDVEPTSIGDAIKVTAANGQTIEVDLDPWEVPGLFSVGAVMAGATTESGSSLQNFLKTGGEYDTKKEKSEAAKLKKFLRENKDESQTIAREDTAYVEPEKMFVTREQREAEVKKINKSYKEVTSLTQDYLKSERDFADKYPQFQTYDPEYIKNNPEEYQMFLADRNILEGEREFLGQMHQNTKDQGAQLDRLAGEYTEMLAERGYWSGGVFRNEFIQGAADIAAGAKDFGLDTGYNPEFLMDTDPEFFRDNYLKEAAAKGYDVPSASDMTVDEFKAWMKTDKGIPAKESIAIQNGIVDTKLKRRKRGEPIDYEEAVNAYSQYATSKNMEVTGGELDALRRGLDFLKDSEATPEAADLMYESFWGGALLGVTRSLPAMLFPIGGWAGRTAAMYSQITGFLEKEMAGDPDFQNISEAERFRLKLAIGSVSSVLEAVGLRNVLKQQGLLTGILMRVLKKTPANVKGKAFNEVVMREVNSAIGRGALVVTSAGLAEFETGFLQEGVDISFKNIYNDMKDKEMFETPETWSLETLNRMLYAGAQEAVGGFVLGTPGAISAARGTYDFTAIDDATFEMFENVSNLTAEGELTYRDMFYTNQQARINRGKISKEDAQQEMDNLDEVIAVNRDIPSDLTINQQKRSLGILLRRKDLQEQIEGKDPILVKRQLEELDGLNGELEEILYGTPEDAIQEQGPESVDAPESTRDSEAVGEGVPDIGEPTTKIETEDDVTDEAPAPTAEVSVEETVPVEVEPVTAQSARYAQLIEDTPDSVIELFEKWTKSTFSPEVVAIENKEPSQRTRSESAKLAAVTRLNNKALAAAEAAGLDDSAQLELIRAVNERLETQEAAPVVAETVSEPTQEVTEEEQVDIDEFFGEQEIEGVERVSENLVINRRQMTSDTRSRAKEQRTINRVKQLAIKAAVSLSKQFPDVRIVLHETPNQYKRFAGELARGSYDYNNKTVHINLTNANLQTVAHEVFHALILEKALDDPNAVILSRKMLESVKKTIDPNSEFAQKIDKFVDSYADRPIVQDEEYLAELTGMLAAQYKTLDKPAQNAIKEFFRKLAKLIGIDKKFGLDEYFGPEFLKTDAEVVDLMNTISRKIRQGVFIESSDLAVMEKIKKKSTPEELKKAREDVEKALDEQERSKREKAESGTGNRRKETAVTPRQQVQEKLIQRSQAASNFTDEELTAFAKEGILFHGSDMQKEFFDSKFIKEFNYGYGFYFTGVPALARKYGDKLSFVDTKEFKLLDGDEDITQEDAQDMLDNLPGYGLDNEFVEEFLQDYIDDEGFENDPQSWSMFITEYISDYESKAEIFSEYLESELGFDGMTTVENAGKGAVPTVAVVWNFDLLNDNVLQDPTKEKVIEEEAPKEVTRKEEATKDVLDFVSLVSKGTSEDVIYLNKRQQVEGINPKDVRMRSRSGNRVGKGLSVKKVNNEAVVEEIPDLTLDYVRENAPASYLKNANLIAQYPLVRGVKNFDDVSTLEQADEVYEVYARQVADNLNWIMESYPEEYREISTLWYDGANKIANELAADYGVSPEQVAGIIASLSPQNDWYQNVRAAELLLLAFRENPVMSQKMIDYQVNYAEGKINDLKKRIKSARKAKGKSQAKAKVEKFKAAEVKNLKAIADAEALLDLLRSYKGKRMEDAPDALKPYYVRLYNEVNQPKSYPIISPDGNYGSDALTDAGGKRKFGWGSYTEIGKGVSIRLDGSQENISVTLGQMHKIRNFFNNIIDPMSKEKDITMDTHAIAAALLIPASSKTKEVVQNFGTGTANSGVKGQKGLYYANQAGYFLSAEENNMLPRQVQSVTWEAVRGLFTSKFKDGAKNVKSINDIWENYAEGNITIEQARQEVLEKADGINAPSWAGLISDESRDGDGTTTERGRGQRGGPASEREGVAPRQQVVYHVTIRDNKGDIQKKGLEKDRPPTFAKGGMGTAVFDTAGKSFAFSNLEDATKWGIKTKIEKDKEVSIVAINAEGKTLQEDKAVTEDPFNPLSSAVFTEDVISPSDILSVEDVDYKMGKPFDKSGEPLTEESFDIKDDVAPRQQLSDIDGPSQRSQKGDASRIHRIISEGRDNNFTDAQILDYLVRKKFATVTQAKDLMKFPVSVVSDLPQSFRDIEGGLKVGLKLYNRVEQFIKKETDRNKRRKSPITEQQIMDLAIANLEEQAEYKAETDTQQMKMQSELQKSLGIKPTKNMAAKLRGLRKTVKERAKGARNLKVVQTELRNFIRKSLPKELYTKREVMDLIRKITAVKTSKELPNLIQEVVDFVSVKNVEALQRSIKDRLNGKYVDKSGKRIKGLKIDPDTNELLKRIREDYLVSEDATFEDIADKNTRLSKRFGELEGNPELTEAEMIEMGAIEIAMRLNNSRTMLDTDVRKAEDLGEVDDMLGEMIIGGREIMASEIRKAKAEYERQFAIAYESITGQKIDLSGTYEDDNGNIKPTDLKYYKAELEKNLRSEEMRNRRKSQESRLKKILSSLQNSFVSFVVDGASELFTLMHKIDIMPGEMFGGEMQELVTERVDAATRENKARMMALDLLLKNKLKELFGKNWEKISRENAKPKVTGIIIDAKAIEKAKKAYEENPSRENKQKLNDAYIDNDLVLSQNESYYLYNQYKDPANEKSFENKFGPDYERIMQEITDGIDPRVKEFADWQVNELFPTLYEQYNAVYRKIFRVNMPWNEFYAGRIYREGVEQPQQDLLPSSEGYKTAVGASSTMSRVENSKPIQTMDGTQALMSYLNDMEYFAAYSETIRDIDKIFSNKYISSSIESIYGKRTVGLINDMIKKLANKGGQNQLGDKFVNNLNNVFIFSRLGISPVIMLKQFTSTLSYANDIGYTNWVKYSAKNLSELGGIWKEVRDNSVYMQDRKFNSITKAIETYKDSDSESLMPGRTKNFFEDVLLANVKFGDRGAIYLGGLPNYSYYKAEFKKKNPKATEQEAIDYAVRRFERDTKRTQQSSDLQDKDYFQTGNPIVRQLNVFLTTPKQYFRKEIQALRNINRKIKAGDMGAGKGSLGENLRTLFTYHILMPVLFQWVAMGLPGMLRGWRDDDDEDLLRAAIIGNINAIFILGEIAVMIGDALTGKPWDATPKSVGVLQIAASITKKAKIWDKTKDPVKKEEHFKRLLWEISTLTGMPGPTLNKMAKNIEKLIEGGEDPGTAILRLFNYSDYQIEGPKNKKKGSEKSSKMSDADMKQYFPELYEMQMQMEEDMKNPELERFEKEMKLLEKQIEESLK